MKNSEKAKKKNIASEPQPAYGSTDNSKTIRIFYSFEEENEFVAKERFALSYNERMLHVEVLRKQIFNKYLLKNGHGLPLQMCLK